MAGLVTPGHGKEPGMIDNLIIRSETPADYKETSIIVIYSFPCVPNILRQALKYHF